MFKLTIGKNGCVISDFDQSPYCFYAFNAETEIFDIDSNNGLVQFMKAANSSDDTLQDAIDAIYTICRENRCQKAIETTLGMYGVTFPTIDEKGALLCNCENIICVVLSVVRYLSANNYKFLLCAHCGKPFCIPISRKTSRMKFCKRKSPCILATNAPNLNYTHLSCADGRKNARQQISRMKKRIRNSIDVSKENQLAGGAVLADFLIKCDNYDNTSASGLKEYYDFLNSEIQKRGLKE